MQSELHILKWPMGHGLKNIRDKILKLLESNEKENVTYQDLRIQQKDF